MKPQQLGELKISKVFEVANGLPLPMMFPDVTREDMARLTAWCDDPTITADPATSMLTMSFHSFVLQIGGYNVLIDACNGNHKTRAMPDVNGLDTPWLANLEATGLSPADIHCVMCTHLHFDHVGWNTRLDNGRWAPTFPNARYVFGKQDYDHWSTQEEEEIHRQAYDDSILPVVAAGQADIVSVDGLVATHHEIGDGIWLEPAFGHSPGSCFVHAQSGGAPALFWGDVIHHPVQLVRPELTLPFDHDPQAAARVRREMLSAVADGDTVCFPAHFGGPSAGRVQADGTAYRFVWADR